jgi:hypothetical protein
LLREDPLRHARVQYFPEVVEIGESPFSPFFPFNRLDDSHQVTRVVLLKPVDPDNIVFHGFLLPDILISQKGLQIGYRKGKIIEKWEGEKEQGPSGKGENKFRVWLRFDWQPQP